MSARAPSRLLAAQVFARDGLKCVRCGGENNLQVDHIVAWSNGGQTVLENLQTLCARCNGAKGPHRRPRRLSPEVERQLRRAVQRRAQARAEFHAAIASVVAQGTSVTAIARAMGVSRQTVYFWASQAKTTDLQPIEGGSPSQTGAAITPQV